MVRLWNQIFVFSKTLFTFFPLTKNINGLLWNPIGMAVVIFGGIGAGGIGGIFLSRHSNNVTTKTQNVKV